jgi:hypothetical protein
MPDLLGANPCEGCEDKVEPCRGPGYEQYESYDCVGKVPEEMTSCQYACGPYAAYAARRAMLEALKAGGVKTNIYPVPVTRKEDSAVLPPFEGLVFAHMPTEGWLIFIPEAQGCS